MDGSSEREPEGDESRREFAVGIIGAGFGGLSLANLLSERQQQQRTRPGGRPRCASWCSFRVFDSRPGGSCSFRGPVRLPSLPRLLAEVPALAVALASEVAAASCDGDHGFDGNDDRVGAPLTIPSRARVLDELGRRVAVRYGCEIVQIVPRQGGGGMPEKNAVNKNANSNRIGRPCYDLVDGEGNRHGPFDAVVAADGALSRFRRTRAVWCVGDARWVQETSWLDLGFSRIQRGADIAIQDALLLADTIFSSAVLYDDDDDSSLSSASARQKLRYFEPHYNRTRWACFVLTRFMIPILLLYIVSLFRIP